MPRKKIDHANRAHATLSASSAARWLACPPSAVAQLLYPNEDTAYTREGTLAHEVAEAFARSMRDGVPAVYNDEATDEMVRHAKDYAAYIQEQIHGDGAVILLEQRLDFSPWVPDGFGTGDCIILQGDTMRVIDYKYGVGVPVSAEKNPQLMLYGLGALNEYGFAYEVEHVKLHVYQPRIDNISVYELTAAELEAWGEDIKPIAEEAAVGMGDYKTGEHCRFCKHAGACRELQRVCTKQVSMTGLRATVPVLAPHEVAEALRMEPLITLWLKRVKDKALTDMLNGEQIPGYKVVEGKQGNRKWADEVAAYKALIAQGCSADEITETKLMSPSAMEKAFGKKRAAELLEIGGVERAAGAPTIALESDKRAPYNRLAEAQKDYE